MSVLGCIGGNEVKTVAFYTLGCKVNNYDTEALSEIFEKQDYKIVNFEEKADVYVVNSCTVTNSGDRKSRQMIRKAKRTNDDAVIVVAGCYAQTSSQELLEMPEVNMVIGNKNRKKIVDFVERIQEDKDEKMNVVGDIMKERVYEDLSVDEMKGKTRAFIKIQEGCNQFCSYCIIPYARGPIRSRQAASVVKEVKRLVDAHYKEVVLTGIHVASYGKDLEEGSLIELIEWIHQIEGLKRIRLSSIEPRLLTHDFLERLSKLPKFCPHFHISLQSGSDHILKAMKRKYSTKEYKQIIDDVRLFFPDVSITTDIMVGFPGEKDVDFKESYSFAKEIAFSKIHVFKYSPREGTPAANYPNQVGGQKKDQRSKQLIALAMELEKKFYDQFLAGKREVLFERKQDTKSNTYEGLTDHYIRVLCQSEKNIEGCILPVILDESFDGYMTGRIIKT